MQAVTQRKRQRMRQLEWWRNASGNTTGNTSCTTSCNTSCNASNKQIPQHPKLQLHVLEKKRNIQHCQYYFFWGELQTTNVITSLSTRLSCTDSQQATHTQTHLPTLTPEQHHRHRQQQYNRSIWRLHSRLKLLTCQSSQESRIGKQQPQYNNTSPRKRNNNISKI